MIRYIIIITLLLILVSSTVCTASQGDWSHLAGDASRVSIALDGPVVIDSNSLDWIAWEDPSSPGYYAEYIGPSCPVTHDGKVYVNAKYYNESGSFTNNQIIAINVDRGQDAWTTVIEKGVLDSWASPTIDTTNNAVLIGSGNVVYSLDADDGSVNWSTELEKSVVNASLCVASGRAFITDYDGFGVTGKLYCINLAANTQDNPYQPGDIVWSDTIGGTSGNTPACRDGVVYQVTPIQAALYMLMMQMQILL